jgi:hypothetical protein
MDIKSKLGVEQPQLSLVMREKRKLTNEKELK